MLAAWCLTLAAWCLSSCQTHSQRVPQRGGAAPLWMGLAGGRASSGKQQASGIKQQASSIRHQAANWALRLWQEIARFHGVTNIAMMSIACCFDELERIFKLSENWSDESRLLLGARFFDFRISQIRIGLDYEIGFWYFQNSSEIIETLDGIGIV